MYVENCMAGAVPMVSSGNGTCGGFYPFPREAGFELHETVQRDSVTFTKSKHEKTPQGGDLGASDV